MRMMDEMMGDQVDVGKMQSTMADLMRMHPRRTRRHLISALNNGPERYQLKKMLLRDLRKLENKERDANVD